MWSGCCISSRSNSSSTGDWYSSSSSRTSAARSSSITVEKFRSWGGASYLRYRIKAMSSMEAAVSQNGSLDLLSLGVVDLNRLVTSRCTSLSSRR